MKKIFKIFNKLVYAKIYRAEDGEYFVESCFIQGKQYIIKSGKIK